MVQSPLSPAPPPGKDPKVVDLFPSTYWENSRSSVLTDERVCSLSVYRWCTREEDMKQDQSDRYPRLSSFLALRCQELKAAFTVQDVAALFDVTSRTIQTWMPPVASTSGRFLAAPRFSRSI